MFDPCCASRAYLAEVLRRIAANLEGLALESWRSFILERLTIRLMRPFGSLFQPPTKPIY